MNKKITIITAIIIIVGIIITLTAGFNVDMLTKKHKEIQVEIGKKIEESEMKEIAKEVFQGQQVEIQTVEVFEDQVLISTDQITDEQKNNLVTKLNEKYETELKVEDIKVATAPKTSLKDYVTPYIVPIIIATALVTLYECIRYKKQGVLKILAQTILGVIIAQMLVFSLLAITRIAVGSNIPAVIIVTYAVSVLCLTCMFEKNYKIIKEEEKKG